MRSKVGIVEVVETDRGCSLQQVDGFPGSAELAPTYLSHGPIA